MSVDEYQSFRGQPPEREFSHRFPCKPVARYLENRLERQLGYGRDIGEPPIFLLKSRKTQLGKPSDARLAQWKNPGRLLRLFFKPLEFFQIGLCFLHRGVCCDLNHGWCS